VRRTTVNRHEWAWCWLSALLVGGVAAYILWAGTAPAHAGPVDRTFQSTSCFTALENPGVRAACREHGWQVRLGPQLVISPHRAVREHGIAPCTDGVLPCGYRIGEARVAWWIDRASHKHYVWGRMPWPVVFGHAHWARPVERRRLHLTDDCWVKNLRGHRVMYRCPTDPDDS
jgi:hypothetical protein